MVAKIVTNDGGGPVVGSITLAGAAVGTPVTCTNLNNTGVLGWKWELIDVPEPSLTLNPIPPPSFANSRVIVPDVAGHTVLVRLTTYTDAPRTVVDGVDQVAIRVQFLPLLDWVIPAASETSEADIARGWATEMNKTLRAIHAALGLALPVAIDIGDASAIGSAVTVARSDHQHALAAPGGVATQVSGSGTIGASTAPARADHVHPMGALTPAAHASTHAAQTGTDPLATAAAGAIAIADTSDTGTAETFARSDHRHALAAPGGPATQVSGSGTVGASTAPARADHVHPMGALAPAAHASTHAAQTGTDPLATAAAGAIAIADTSNTGTAETFSRSDHRHALAAPGTPANQVVGAGAAGVSTKVAREDHVHPMSATDAVDVVYGPTTPGDWYATDPVNVEEALDRLAKLRALTIPTFAAAQTFDFSDDKNWQKVTLTANMTSITLTPPRQIGTVVLEFVQDGTGGRTVAGWPATTLWAGGVKPTFGDAAGTTRLVTAWWDGANYFCEFRPETYIA